jgi:hypothetical protein
MISYDSSIMLSPNGNWLKPPRMHSGVPVTVPYVYYCDGHRVTGFNKYTLPSDATEQYSGTLPSSIRIKGHSEPGTNIGYRIDSGKFDNVLTGITFGDDPTVGLYLDGCYNLNNGTINMEPAPHTAFTLDGNCLRNTAGTLEIENNDITAPIYFGANCATNMDLVIKSNTYISRIGANSFRNITFGHDNMVGNVDPNCCVNMTQPMSFGNHSEVYSDLEPFILAHKDRCDELGIKAITFGNDCKIYNASRIKIYYGSYITYQGSLTEVPVTSHNGIIME